MSNIKALDKLRESSHLDDSKWTLENGDVVIMLGRAPDDPNAVNWGEQWREISDAIESEVAERFIELPCDAEGVPWHVGDVTENGNVVKAITFDRIGAHFTGTVNDIDPSIHTHSKPRTIEDVLVDFAPRWMDAFNPERKAMLVEEYADEIRELRGDAE